MRITRHVNIALLTICLSLILFGSIKFATCQTSPTKKAEIVNIYPYIAAVVEFQVRATDKQLVIPVCRNEAMDSQYLCVAHLQRFIDGDWKNATPRKEIYATLGFDSKDRWTPKVIEPGDQASFRIGLSKELFGIRTGERLRFMLEVWDNVESMTKNDKPDNYLISPFFDCP